MHSDIWFLAQNVCVSEANGAAASGCFSRPNRSGKSMWKLPGNIRTSFPKVEHVQVEMWGRWPWRSSGDCCVKLFGLRFTTNLKTWRQPAIPTGTWSFSFLCSCSPFCVGNLVSKVNAMKLAETLLLTSYTLSIATSVPERYNQFPCCKVSYL